MAPLAFKCALGLIKPSPVLRLWSRRPPRSGAAGRVSLDGPAAIQPVRAVAGRGSAHLPRERERQIQLHAIGHDLGVIRPRSPVRGGPGCGLPMSASVRERSDCQSAFNIDPGSASKIDPLGEAVTRSGAEEHPGEGLGRSELGLRLAG